MSRENLPIAEKLPNPENLSEELRGGGLRALEIAKKRNRQAGFKDMANYMAEKWWRPANLSVASKNLEALAIVKKRNIQRRLEHIANYLTEK